MAERRGPDWSTLAGIAVTAGLATLANVVHGALAVAFIVVSLGTGLVILASVNLGWPLPHLNDDRYTRLRRQAVRLANRLKDCTEAGRTQPTWPVPSSYGTAVTGVQLLRAPVSGRRRRRFGRLAYGRLRRVIEELGQLGLRDQYLAQFIYSRPGSDQFYEAAQHLYDLASLPQPT